MSDADIAALGGADANGIIAAPAGAGLVPPPKFNSPVVGSGQVTITWTGGGTLQESTNLLNWTAVPGNPTSPYVVPVSLAPKKFYRVQQ